MKTLKRKAREKALEVCIKTRAMFMKNDGFGLNEILGAAAALIIASFIIIPRMSELAKSIMTGLDDWWEEISKTILSSK